MVLYVKNKLISLTGSSFAVNEEGEKLFEIAGKLFSPTRKKFVKTLDGKLLYIVRNKFFHLFKKKSLIYDGESKEKVCKLKERIFSLKLDVVDCEDDITMEGSLLDGGYSVCRNGQEIGTWMFSVKGVSDVFRDSYRIEVYDPADAAFMVALTIANDNIRDNRRGK